MRVLITSLLVRVSPYSQAPGAPWEEPEDARTCVVSRREHTHSRPLRLCRAARRACPRPWHPMPTMGGSCPRRTLERQSARRDPRQGCGERPVPPPPSLREARPGENQRGTSHCRGQESDRDIPVSCDLMRKRAQRVRHRTSSRPTPEGVCGTQALTCGRACTERAPLRSPEDSHVNCLTRLRPRTRPVTEARERGETAEASGRLSELWAD